MILLVEDNKKVQKFNKRYYLVQPFKEIGTALEITEDAAKKLHRRALESLQKCLKNERPFPEVRVYNPVNEILEEFK